MNNSEFIEALKEHAGDDLRQFDAITDAIAGVVRQIEAVDKKMDERFDKVEDTINPLTEAYDGVIFGKKLLTGIAAVIIALAAIGGGIIWVIQAAVNTKH